MELYRRISGRTDPEFLTSIISSRTRAYGNTATFGGITAQWDGNNATLVSGGSQLSEYQQRAIALAIMSGAVINSSYKPEAIIRAFGNFDTRTQHLIGAGSTPLYEENEPFFNLSPGVRYNLRLSSLNTSACALRFLTLVSSYLSREATAADLAGTSTIPVVTVSYERKGGGIETTKYPKFLVKLVPMLSRVLDELDDEARYVKLKTYTRFASSITKSFSETQPNIAAFCGAYLDVLGSHLLSTAPSNFSIEERTFWLSTARKRLLDHVLLFYNYRAGHVSNEDMLKNIEILPQDNLHSLSKVIVAVIGGRRLGEKEIYNFSNINYMVDIAISIRNANEGKSVSLVEVLDAMLIYFSIHGTSRNRVVKYPTSFVFRLKTMRFELNTSAVNDWVKRAKIDGINYIRLACRAFATRAVILRKMCGVRHNPFKSLPAEDPYLTFDFVNYCDYSLLNPAEIASVSRIAKYISYSDKTTRDVGGIYSR